MCGGGGIGKAIGGIGKAIGSAVSGVVNAVKTVAKNPIFQAVAPIALNMFLPGLGVAASGALGLSAAWAPAIGGALTGGVMGALGGGGLGGALKGAAIGGIASGVGDYLMTGNNPLSGMFSGTEGGAANNVLSAGGTGSTQLTGAGSGLGIDRSTVGTQFGQLNPNPSAAPFGEINPNAASGGPGIRVPTTPPNLSQPSGGPLSGLLSKAKSLIPDSTLGKVALGGTALSLLSGGGGGQRAAGSEPPPNPAQTDPQFTRRLTPLLYNPNAGDTSQINQTNAHLFVNRRNPGGALDQFRDINSGARPLWQTPGINADIDPATGQPRLPTAAGGGRIPYYAMGGLTRYATGGMPDVETDHGYLKGPGDGVSDDIPAMIGDKQPARLAGGEFVIPARIVSELGNGSSDAGAQRLHQFMERVNERRLKTKDFAKDTKAYDLLPA